MNADAVHVLTFAIMSVDGERNAVVDMDTDLNMFEIFICQ